MKKFTLTVGPLTFRPEPYFQFTVGPLQADIDIPEGKTIDWAYKETRAILRELQKKEFIEQRDAFWEMRKAMQ